MESSRNSRVKHIYLFIEIVFIEFDPEHSPKWKVLSDLLLEEIPEEVKKKQKGGLHNTKILILCQDGRTCAQLNHFLTMGANKYLFYTAFRRDLTIHTVSSKYTNLKNTAPATSELEKEQMVSTKSDEDSKDVNKLEEEDSEELKTNYILTLTQVATQGDKKQSDASIFEPISQVNMYTPYFTIITINILTARPYFWQ